MKGKSGFFIALIMILLIGLSSAAVYAGSVPKTTIKRIGDTNTYRLTYTGAAENKGKLINVFAYRASAANETGGASISDGNFLDGETAVIGTDGSFETELKVKPDSEGVVIYLGGQDDLLPGGTSPDLQQCRILGIPQKVSAAAVNFNSIKLSWNAVSGAKQYRILRAGSEGAIKTAKTLAIVDAQKGTVYTDSNLDTGTAYYYAVQAYDTSLAGDLSDCTSAVPRLSATAISSLKAGKKSMTIKWKKVAGASGYAVYQSTKQKSGYKCIKTITKAKTVKFTKKKLKSKKKYFYKIRAYRIVKGKKVWAGYSPVKSKKAK